MLQRLYTGERKLKKKAKDFMMNTLFSGMSMEDTDKEAGKAFHCTLCGKPFDFWDVQEGLGFKYWMGFGSKYDGEHIRLSLCIQCFDSLIDELAPKCVESPFISGKEFAEDDLLEDTGGMTEKDYRDLMAHLHGEDTGGDDGDEEAEP